MTKETFKKFFTTKEYLRIEIPVILIAILFIILWSVGIFRSGEQVDVQRGDTGGENIASAFDAYDAAFGVARGWHEDAMLSTLSSNTAKNGEMIDSWRFIFISVSAPRRGFIVDILGDKVTSSYETDYVGTGAAFSATGIISQGEAVRRIHALVGYENEIIMSIQAVYDPVAKSWYWAAKTPKGIVSIEANQ